jgi:hypothetical protein
MCCASLFLCTAPRLPRTCTYCTPAISARSEGTASIAHMVVKRAHSSWRLLSAYLPTEILTYVHSFRGLVPAAASFSVYSSLSRVGGIVVSRNIRGLDSGKVRVFLYRLRGIHVERPLEGESGGGSNCGACATIHSNISLTCFITYATSSLHPPVSFPPLLHSILIGVVGPDIERQGCTRAKSSANSIDINVVSSIILFMWSSSTGWHI